MLKSIRREVRISARESDFGGDRMRDSAHETKTRKLRGDRTISPSKDVYLRIAEKLIEEDERARVRICMSGEGAERKTSERQCDGDV